MNTTNNKVVEQTTHSIIAIGDDGEVMIEIMNDGIRVSIIAGDDERHVQVDGLTASIFLRKSLNAEAAKEDSRFDKRVADNIEVQKSAQRKKLEALMAHIKKEFPDGCRKMRCSECVLKGADNCTFEKSLCNLLYYTVN